MLHRLAYYAASFFVKHDLIDTKYFALLQYKAETLINTVFFSLLLLLISVVSHSYVEIIIFSLATCLFRQRMGGCHASTPWVCQLLSLTTVVFMVFLIGPIISSLPTPLIFCLCIGMDLVAYILPPAYPPQLHLNEKEIQMNVKRKNQILIFTFIVQTLSLPIDTQFSVYSLLGLATTVLTVLLEMINIQRKGRRT